ncbi:WG repeat-containing protein [Moraxella pluranimalium]|uniref:WG repeat-containing protein n=1 Tax=Moraxella pluranimalium TaxID=470453 RepID=A0A1T0CMU0_9GAMM|nr:WG repeat-containing protein [Moraxella pluranimalium]OOS23657.1 hypothetical protein B0680_06810 [Moraxella pluranimalium]
MKFSSILKSFVITSLISIMPTGYAEYSETQNIDRSKCLSGNKNLPTGLVYNYDMTMFDDYGSCNDLFDEFGYAVVKNTITQKVGMVNRQGKTVIAFDYEDVNAFSEGLAAIKQNDKWGYINKNGQIVINPQYDDVGFFSDGMAWVSLNDQVGIIDKHNNIIVPTEYDRVDIPSNGYIAVAKNERLYYYTTEGKKAFEHSFDLPNNIIENINRFSDGMAVVGKVAGYNSNNTAILEYGYVDTTGNLVIDYQFKSPFAFSEGLAGILGNQLDTPIGELHEVYYIDKTGKTVIPADYLAPQFPQTGSYAGMFSNGLAPVGIIPDRYEGDYPIVKYGYIDKTGKLIIDYQFNEAMSFGNLDMNDCYYTVDQISSDTALVVNNGQFQLINRKGKKLATIPEHKILDCVGI